MGFSINTLTINGNLTRDPELRTLPSGASVCQLRIGHNSRRKEGDNWIDVPNYFDVSIWRGQGEWLAKNLSKGDGVVVHGDLRWREWTDKDGNKRQSVDINAQDVIPMPREGRSSSSSSSSSRSYDEYGELPVDSPPVSTGVAVADDDDIPF